jgi:hypothetical protein
VTTIPTIGESLFYAFQFTLIFYISWECNYIAFINNNINNAC